MIPSAPSTYEALATLIDHPLVKPELTDEQVVEGLELAKRYGSRLRQRAALRYRPGRAHAARQQVKPGAVCGFPHGPQNTATKLYETRDLLRRGAREIDMVIAISKLLSREFQHVQMELLQMSELCHKEGALLKVILENGLPDRRAEDHRLPLLRAGGSGFRQTQRASPRRLHLPTRSCASTCPRRSA